MRMNWPVHRRTVTLLPLITIALTGCGGTDGPSAMPAGSAATAGSAPAEAQWRDWLYTGEDLTCEFDITNEAASVSLDAARDIFGADAPALVSTSGASQVADGVQATVRLTHLDDEEEMVEILLREDGQARATTYIDYGVALEAFDLPSLQDLLDATDPVTVTTRVTAAKDSKLIGERVNLALQVLPPRLLSTAAGAVEAIGLVISTADNIVAAGTLHDTEGDFTAPVLLKTLLTNERWYGRAVGPVRTLTSYGDLAAQSCAPALPAVEEPSVTDVEQTCVALRQTGVAAWTRMRQAAVHASPDLGGDLQVLADVAEAIGPAATTDLSQDAGGRAVAELLSQPAVQAMSVRANGASWRVVRFSEAECGVDGDSLYSSGDLESAGAAMPSAETTGASSGQQAADPAELLRRVARSELVAEFTGACPSDVASHPDSDAVCAIAIGFADDPSGAVAYGLVYPGAGEPSLTVLVIPTDRTYTAAELFRGDDVLDEPPGWLDEAMRNGIWSECEQLPAGNIECYD
ncbi:MAG TPA: hypothetical protein VM307_15530 [Egibacteraceae bacterium]|nr:hypothetical protein [Egibacteraceae bacterium]